jgi:hypothetical protein
MLPADVPQLGNDELEHIALLMVHRPGVDLVLDLRPDACPVCKRIAEWAEALLRARRLN